MAESLDKKAKHPDDRTEAEVALAEADQDARGASVDVTTPSDDPKQKNKLPEIHVSEIAVINSREDLNRVLKEHALWMKSVFDLKAEVSKGRANLRGVDLRQYDLSGAELGGADLSGANLQGVEMARINLTAANLRDAKMQAANLRDARLTRAKIDGADLRGADLTGAMLLGVDLTKAILKSPETPETTEMPLTPEIPVGGKQPAPPLRRIDGASRHDVGAEGLAKIDGAESTPPGAFDVRGKTLASDDWDD